jgi:hypothetical protein
MIYHGYWPPIVHLELKASEKAHFNKYQIEYIEKMHDKIHKIYAGLNSTDKPDIRLLWYKELLAIFSEMVKINRFKTRIDSFEPYMKDMVDLVQFIRNLLFHFPYFSTWDEVVITYNQAFAQQQNDPSGNRKDRELVVAKFLNPNNHRESFFLRLKYLSEEDFIEDKIMFPKPDSKDEAVYLKNIIKENKGLKCIIAVMQQIFRLFMVRKDISACNISLNNSSKKIDDFVKKELKKSNVKIEHRLGYKPDITKDMFDKYTS